MKITRNKSKRGQENPCPLTRVEMCPCEKCDNRILFVYGESVHCKGLNSEFLDVATLSPLDLSILKGQIELSLAEE